MIKKDMGHLFLITGLVLGFTCLVAWLYPVFRLLCICIGFIELGMFLFAGSIFIKREEEVLKQELELDGQDDLEETFEEVSEGTGY
jgi:hypothetical protein